MNEEHIDIDEVSEALNVAQRLRRAKVMKRFAKKLARRRKIVLDRAANSTRLKSRSKKRAHSSLKSKYAGGRKTGDMSFGEKARVENIVKRKRAMVQRLSNKMIKDVRKDDIGRRSVKEDVSAREMGKKSLVDIYRQDTPGEEGVLSAIQSFRPDMTYAEFVKATKVNN